MGYASFCIRDTLKKIPILKFKTNLETLRFRLVLLAALHWRRLTQAVSVRRLPGRKTSPTQNDSIAPDVSNKRLKPSK